MTRIWLFAAIVAAGALGGAPARAEDPGDTSGPAAGTPVTPPTAVQKDNVHIPDITPPGVSGPSGTAAGAPGIEAKPGTQAGKEWLPPEELRKRPSM